ncbi:MAG: rRNA maturation RNase YbeY [Pseudomonadota bacterium]
MMTTPDRRDTAGPDPDPGNPDAVLEVQILTSHDGWHAIPAVMDRITEGLCTAAAHVGLVLPAQVSLLLTGDGEIRAINRDHRGKDSPTNVLSFPQIDMSAVDVSTLSALLEEQAPMGDDVPALGDIALSIETLTREAEADGKTLNDHLIHLVVHGFLHLIGHDHEADDMAEAMEAEEIAILHRLNIANPYAELTHAPVETRD